VTHAGIPRNLPMPMLPWHAPGPGGEPLVLSFNVIESLGHYGVAIAMLGAIESLLSAVVADGMTGYKHDPDAELFAQGIGNFIVPWFGGIAATGAIARTAASIRSGANSPVASIVHAGFVLAAMLLFAPLLGHLPMAAMAALLIVVAKNMSEAKHFANMLRVGPRGDVAVLLLCFALTVLFDMVIAVSVGVVMAALLFMQRMAAVSGTRLADEHPFGLDKPLPEGVILYEIAGPLFFGAAQKATSALTTIADATTVVVLDLRSVPVMDATGLVNLESAVERLLRGGTYVILAGVQRQPKRLMARAGLGRRRHELAICSTFERGIRLARAAAELTAKNAAAHR
jgi:SulP family sulfate permease